MTEDGKHCSIEQKEVRLVYLYEITMFSIHFENHLFRITISEMLFHLYFTREICYLYEFNAIRSELLYNNSSYCTISVPFDLIDELINKNCVGEGNGLVQCFLLLIVAQILD